MPRSRIRIKTPSSSSRRSTTCAARHAASACAPSSRTASWPSRRTRAGKLVAPAKIGAAVHRVVRSCPARRGFVTTIAKRFFSGTSTKGRRDTTWSWYARVPHHDLLSELSAPQVLRYYPT